jgi:DNA-binding GntR family transcriptional regulator
MNKITTSKPQPGTKQAKGAGAKFVYKFLKDEILSLEIAPGTPLDETSLSERFSMSRSPIREAIIRLSTDGLVETLSNRSTIVSTVDLSEFPRYVEALDLLQRINTRLAAQNRTKTDILKMQATAKRFEEACASNDHLEMSESNRDFHMSLAAAGKNTYLAHAYGQLLDQGRRILHMHFDYIQSSTQDHLLISEHFEMLDAIQNGDVQLADQLAHAHTRQFHDRFARFLQAKYADDFEFDKYDI